ncbi:MAG: 6-carboxytetrahydropterin synthase QueD [Gammaproteobacteria bacterium]|nr:6-carboxytetrahydropterin synthase QueD [Gammaproteobacteria bacterium]
MFTISKQFHFSASHQLKKLPKTHPCARLHGHNYVVEIVLQSKKLDEFGFVRDYTELNQLKQLIKEKLDHRHLNDVLGDDCVTAEQLARWIYEWCKNQWPEVVAVRVSETPKTWAEYRA